jgi:hypothetical protein
MKMEKIGLQANWADIDAQFNEEGCAMLPGFLSASQVHELTQACNASDGAIASLEAEGLGRGRCVYLRQSAVPWIEDLRRSLYGALVPIANRWNDALDLQRRYPDTLGAFLDQSVESGQTRSQSNLTRLREDDYQALHQRSDGEHVFPLQVVGLLSEPGNDFTGGEFVMTEQRPRMQSRPMVLPLRKGDVAIIASAHRPHRGTKGFYRVNLKHAISRVRSGERIGFELLLHPARSKASSQQDLPD